MSDTEKTISFLNSTDTATDVNPVSDPTATVNSSDSDSLSIEELRTIQRISDGNELSDYGDLRTIGIGGMGAVFEADDPALDRKVALKILRANYRKRRSSVERFIREARITAKIDHPNIISVHRLGVLDGLGVYFTMKRVRGETLKTILSELTAGNKKLRRIYTLRRLLEIFLSGCNAVAAAHAGGIIHCDLKPGNIMIGDFGEVLVLDLGVAAFIRPAGPELPLEKTADKTARYVEGTPAFMAPELLTGEVAYPDEQTDVYSLGTILYSILTWQIAPFDVSLPKEELIQLIAAGKSIPFKGHTPKGESRHPELEAICKKAMSRDRMERYRSVDELQQDIYNYLDRYPVSAYSPNIFYRFFKFIRRHPLVPSVILAAGLTVGSYYAFNRIVAYAEASSLNDLLTYNQSSADNSMRLIVRRLQRLRDPDSDLSREERSKLMQNISFDASNANLKYGLALDAANRFPPLLRRNFLAAGGTAIFRRMISLQFLIGNDQMAGELVRRFTLQWDALFRMALNIDKELAGMVKLINDKVGVIKIVGKNGSPWRWTLDDATTANNDIPLNAAGTTLVLPAGRHTLTFRNQAGGKFIAFMDVPLGRRRKYDFSMIPELPQGFCFVPPDGSMVKYGEFNKLNPILPGFLIAEYPIRQRRLFSHAEAVDECKKLSKKLGRPVRLPTAAEWQKAIFGGNRQFSFYGMHKSSVPEWLYDGSAVINDTIMKKTPPAASFRFVMPLNSDPDNL